MSRGEFSVRGNHPWWGERALLLTEGPGIVLMDAV